MNPFALHPVQLGCDDDLALERIYMESPGLYWVDDVTGRTRS